MARNRKNHGNKMPTGATTTPSTTDIVSMRDTVVNTSINTNTRHLPNAIAARTVFNTVELLELVLKHLPTTTLTRALSVSRHCRDVILGNEGLRQKLFLEPTQAKEYLEWEIWDSGDAKLKAFATLKQVPGRLEANAETPGQHNRHSRTIVEAHPILAINYRFSLRLCGHRLPNYRLDSPTQHSRNSYFPFLQSPDLFCSDMDKVPAQTLLFQPPVARVDMYHHGYKVALERREGVTFGTVTEQLKKINVEDEQYFRQHYKEIIEKVGKLPNTRKSRQAYASALKLLNGPCEQNWCTSLGVPCLYLEAEGAIPYHAEAVREARRQAN